MNRSDEMLSSGNLRASQTFLQEMKRDETKVSPASDSSLNGLPSLPVGLKMPVVCGKRRIRSATLTRHFLAATMIITVTGFGIVPAKAAQATSTPAESADKVATDTVAPNADSTDQIVFRITQANLGPGYTWGNGVLHFKNTDYAIRVAGGGAPAIGYSNACVQGSVTGLANVEDFDSTFWAINTEASAGSGTGSMALQNHRGTELHLNVKSHGVRLSAAAERLRFHVLGPAQKSFDSQRCS